MRKVATTRKQQEQGLGSTPNVALKATLKRKNNAKDHHLLKKEMGLLIGEQ